MKKIFLLVLSLVITGSMFAQQYPLIDLPVANTDGFMAAKVNPAALSFDESDDIGFMVEYDEDGLIDSHSLICNLKGLTYVHDYYYGKSYHQLASSVKLINNVYFGTSFYWNNDKFKKGNYDLSLLLRPADFISFGAIARDIEHDNPDYRFGVAMRPFFFNDFTHRITLSADFNYKKPDNKYEMEKPILGIQTQVFDGISVNGSYNLEDETIGMNLGVALCSVLSGSLFNTNKDVDYKKGTAYVAFSGRHFRSVFEPQNKNFQKYAMPKEVVEQRSGTKIGPFTIVSPKGKTLPKLLEEIKKMKDDDRINGLVIQSGNFSTTFANMMELRDAFLDFKASGKKIIFYYDNIGNSNYAFAASIADKIYLNPLGEVDLRGISASSPYLKTLLDTLGIDFTNFRSHPYKTAGNMFAETEMTPEEREALDFLLEGIYTELKDMIVSGRSGKLNGSIEEIIDNGPYMIGRKALDAGLIDGLVNQDEVEDLLTEEYKINKIAGIDKRERPRIDWSDAGKDKIAVIYATGNIHMGKGIHGKSIGSETTAKLIRQAREDKSVKGIVLRVDSGGGSALASDIIAREVMLCKDGKNRKPVVVSMGGVAASGGYYISAHATKIVAQPATITGSIGVISMIPSFERLFKKIHINWSTVKKGEHSDFMSTKRKLTQDEYDMISESVENIYDVFIDVVAKGRGMNKDKVHQYAQGRVWTGKQAYEIGLVDELGGLDTAINIAKEEARIKREIEIVDYLPQNKLEIKADLGPLSYQNAMETLPDDIKAILEMKEILDTYQNEKALYLLPYRLNIAD
ncbi:MAG: signal peptide peptidase SppA [Candidatus Cloacimonetes bacterium]|nr:signal peptide peptidase SppA [Candidatus Cloacimonadota bacterium]